LKIKSILTIFAIATLLVGFSSSYSGFTVYAQDSVDDTQRDKPSQTDREKIKEKIDEEKQKIKEFREKYKVKLEEKKKQFVDYKKDLREKYNALKDEYREKYLQLRISTTSVFDEYSSADSISSDSKDQNYQIEIKREELKLLKYEFREQIKSLKLEAREHFDMFKADMKSSIEDRKNKMHDRIDALKEKYKHKIVEHDSSDSINVDGYPPEFSDKKVNVCHIPPGNPENDHTISISVNALRAHFAHGDYLDECEDQSNGESDEEEAEDNAEEDGVNYKVELKEELGLEQTEN